MKQSEIRVILRQMSQPYRRQLALLKRDINTPLVTLQHHQRLVTLFDDIEYALTNTSRSACERRRRYLVNAGLTTDPT